MSIFRQHLPTSEMNESKLQRHKRRIAGVDGLMGAVAGLLTVGFIILTTIFLVRLPVWIGDLSKISSSKDRISVENDLLKTGSQFGAGALLLIGFYFTWKTIRVSQEGQITDRFNRAIDHLGDSNIDVRLGGIYALVRIAADSKKDAPSIGDIFCAYVRNKTAQLPGEVPSADVQTVLRWIASGQNHEFAVDLRKSTLMGADLRASNLQSALLEDCNLRNANCERGNLDNADLAGADCRKANLKGSSMRNANLMASNFEEARLRGADLRGANIFGARFEFCNLSGVNMSRATGAIRQQFQNAITDDGTTLPEFEISEE